MIDPAEREKIKRRIWAQQDKTSRRAIMRKEGITSGELGELYDEAIKDYRGNVPKYGMIGKHFGALEVVSQETTYIAANRHAAYTYLCHCQCGKTRLVTGGDLIKRRVDDCGCGIYQQQPKEECHKVDWGKKVEVRHYA